MAVIINANKYATKIGAYYNARGKLKKNVPMFDKNKILPGDEIMVYDYERGRHVLAIIDTVMPEEILFKYKNGGIPGSYKATTAHQLVEGTQLPHVYLV